MRNQIRTTFCFRLGLAIGNLGGVHNDTSKQQFGLCLNFLLFVGTLHCTMLWMKATHIHQLSFVRSTLLCSYYKRTQENIKRFLTTNSTTGKFDGIFKTIARSSSFFEILTNPQLWIYYSKTSIWTFLFIANGVEHVAFVIDVIVFDNQLSCLKQHFKWMSCALWAFDWPIETRAGRLIWIAGLCQASPIVLNLLRQKPFFRSEVGALDDGNRTENKRQF